jgi:hypothetical protein
MPDIRDRFRSLDRQAAPDVWNEATVRSQAAGPQRAGWLPRVGGALAVAVVMVLGVFIGLQLVGAPPPGGPAPSPEAVWASVESGDFRLTITAPRATWDSDEVIEVEATLEYLGDEEVVSLWGSGAGVVNFGLVEESGDRRMDPVWEADCGPHEITPDEPLGFPFTKSGSYSEDDPDADFWEAYFADPELRLPAGEWQVFAQASFDPGETCTATPTEMTASIVLTVEGPSAEPSWEPTAEPSEPAEPSVEPSAEPTDAEALPPFECGWTNLGMETEGAGHAPLLTQDIRVGTHDGYDRIVFEYEGGTPDLQLDVAEPPYVRDPSGEPMPVAGSRVYRITLMGATKWDLSGDTAVLVYEGPTNFEPGYPQLDQLVESGDIEATHSWYLGTRGADCMRAFTLDDPDRLVIDIQH